jgi:hypothetical protein
MYHTSNSIIQFHPIYPLQSGTELQLVLGSYTRVSSCQNGPSVIPPALDTDFVLHEGIVSDMTDTSQFDTRPAYESVLSHPAAHLRVMAGVDL